MLGLSLLLLRTLTALHFGSEIPQRLQIVEARGDYVYRMKTVTAVADEPFCFSVLEAIDGKQSRALYLGCHAGHGKPVVATLKSTRIRGGHGRYQVVVFPSPNGPIVGSVLVTSDYEREKAP